MRVTSPEFIRDFPNLAKYKQNEELIERLYDFLEDLNEKDVFENNEEMRVLLVSAFLGYDHRLVKSEGDTIINNYMNEKV